MTLSPALPDPAQPTPRRRAPRLRLRPEQRIGLILDAALEEFGARGYAATRIEDIARRAGLSKGGLYAHFQGKEAVFEALLTRSLPAPGFGLEDAPTTPADAVRAIDLLVERLHAGLLEPRALSMTRLLCAEGGRLPAAAALWRERTLDSALAQLSAFLERGRARGLFRDSVLARTPALALAPVTQWLLQRLAFGDDAAPALLEARRAHAALLRELLLPPGADER